MKRLFVLAIATMIFCGTIGCRNSGAEGKKKEVYTQDLDFKDLKSSETK